MFSTFFKSDGFFNYLKPVSDVYEDKNKIVLEAELPGIDLDDVKISIDGDILSVSGSVPVKKKDNIEYFRMERQRGSFSRTFILPAGIEREKISASYDKGILTVTIPKKAPNHIDIKIT